MSMANSGAVIAFLPFLLCQTQTQSAEIAEVRREVRELSAQLSDVRRDLKAIKLLLDKLSGSQPVDPFADQVIDVTGAPSRGDDHALVTVIEVSDYHCPFCRRQSLETLPQILADYVDKGRVKYVFVDFPVVQLHPHAEKTHEAAACAGDQNKYWPMHDLLFQKPPATDSADLIATAASIGLDSAKFASCLNEGQGSRHESEIQDRVARMRELGVAGTPLVLVGVPQRPGNVVRILRSVYGAQPYGTFKAILDEALNQDNR